jgi:hypothetical protein
MGRRRSRNPDAIVELGLRCSEALRRRIEYAAQDSKRSINTEIVFRVTQSFERDAAEKERVAWFSKLLGHVLAASDGTCSKDEALARIAAQLTTIKQGEVS